MNAKIQRLLFALKQSYICYHIICMTVPLRKKVCIFGYKNLFKQNYILDCVRVINVNHG